MEKPAGLLAVVSTGFALPSPTTAPQVQSAVFRKAKKGYTTGTSKPDNMKIAGYSDRTLRVRSKTIFSSASYII